MYNKLINMENLIRILKTNKAIIILGVLILSCILIFFPSGGNNYSEIGFPARENRNGDYGYVGVNGNILVDFTIDKEPSIMTEGIGFYRDYDESDKSFFITYVRKDGEEFKTRYTQSLSFNGDLALVTTATGKLTYINTEYEEVLALDDAEEAGYFVEGLAKYKSKDGKWGFKNTKGKTVIDPEYDYVESFNEGYAMVRKRIDGEDFRGIIDKNGDEIMQLDDKYDKLSGVHEDLIIYEEKDEIGFLNLSGEEIIKDDDWDYISPFYNGYATIKESREFGLINKNGEFKIKIREDFPIILCNNKYVYVKDREWGYKDINQDIIIPADFDDALPFFVQGAWVKDNKDWVYINKKGKIQNEIELYDIEIGFDKITLMASGKPPLDLDETLESNFVDIQGFISEIVNIDRRIFGVIIDESNPNDVISFINSIDINSGSKPKAINTKDYIISKISSGSTRISTYDLFGYTEFDRNFSYHIKYYFSNKILERTDIDYIVNRTSFVNRIKFYIDLNNKAYGKDDQIVENLYQSLEFAGFNLDGNGWIKFEDGICYEVFVDHSSGSISLDFRNYCTSFIDG